MKLYDFPRAPNPRRVRWFMAEKGIEDEIEIVSVDILTGEHKSPEYRSKAGLSHVPALEIDDQTCITESVAICRYLEALYPQPNLFGRDPRETAQIEMWTRRCEIYLANPLMLATRHTHPAFAALESPVPAVGEYNQTMAGRFLKALDRQLEGREFIVADRFTMADLVAVTGLDFARLIKFQPPETLANVQRWYAAMRERPAAVAGGERRRNLNRRTQAFEAGGATTAE
ncbi:glutathione S-transferase family protein [Caulobacter sp. 17J80-11]|uniref:glutathione S-transferase family protein n=1 Tax=Caulobacter sp. 17J80-11 TaxID=2763502 RepID=UPI0016537187|nr:glutathione S-transferase family protein [Caulobacter sp. 17J80-11]MBC6983481.1 glutathione S-transferase family protein [Caulobacter sp. 17J80-11]